MKLLSEGALILIVAAALLAAHLPVAAAVEEVEVALTGGEVTGKVRGQGTASVIALVTNHGAREIGGIRIGVYYSAVDQLPGEDAGWRVHEFVFEPPLQPGKSSTLRFSDEGAAEYVLIEVTRAQFALGLSYNGRIASLQHGLMERDGATYVSTRELMELIGGGISYDASEDMVILERGGNTVKVREGIRHANVNGERVPLEHRIIEIDDRSFLPLREIAPLLGLVMERDPALNLIVLSDST